MGARRERYDLVLVGGGTGGLVAAMIAAAVGAKTALIEHERTGGDCLWTGCVPGKGLLATADLAHRIRHANRVGLAPAEPDIDFARVIAHVRGVRADRAAGLARASARRRGRSDRGIGHVSRARPDRGGRAGAELPLRDHRDRLAAHDAAGHIPRTGKALDQRDALGSRPGYPDALSSSVVARSAASWARRSLASARG